jgi:hypothetical protein
VDSVLLVNCISNQVALVICVEGFLLCLFRPWPSPLGLQDQPFLRRTMESDIESRRFQVPSEIVKELEAGGYVSPDLSSGLMAGAG